MLHFLKRKPFLKDLIPDAYVDIHSHLLPGIDDGSTSDADTLYLISELKNLRFDQLITTPHIMKNVWDNDSNIINQKLEDTKAMLTSEKAEIPLHAAAEYILDSYFESSFKSEPLLTLKDNYVLVEMSYLNPPIQLYDIIFDLQLAGYQPVLAHPERYLFYHQKFSEYEKLKHSGCLFQLNLLSIVGYYGKSVAQAAMKLLKNDLIDFTGSDVHHRKHIQAFSERILIKDISALSDALARNEIFRLPSKF